MMICAPGCMGAGAAVVGSRWVSRDVWNAHRGVWSLKCGESFTSTPILPPAAATILCCFGCSPYSAVLDEGILSGGSSLKLRSPTRHMVGAPAGACLCFALHAALVARRDLSPSPRAPSRRPLFSRVGLAHLPGVLLLCLLRPVYRFYWRGLVLFHQTPRWGCCSCVSCALIGVLLLCQLPDDKWVHVLHLGGRRAAPMRGWSQRVAPVNSLSESKAGNQRAIALRAFLVQIRQQPPPLADHHPHATLRMDIVLMNL